MTGKPAYEDLEKRVRLLEEELIKAKQAEGACRESEAKQRFLLDRMMDTIWILDMNMRPTYVSPSSLRVLGYSPEERAKQHLSDMVTPETYARVVEAFARELEKDGAKDADPDRLISIDMEYYHKNGHTVWLENRVRAIRGADGRIVGVYGVSRDITERRAMEEALRASEARFKSIITTSKEWIWAIDKDGRHTFSNPAVTNILGYTADEMIGRKAQHFMHKEDIPKAEEVLAQCMEQKTGWTHLVVCWMHKQGGYRYLESNAVPILDRESNLLGFQGSDRDVTERILAQEALRENEKRYRELCIVDDLTQLYNARHFQHQLMAEIHRANRYGQPLSLLFLDLDDFKRFNDEYGHVEGDEVLMRIGQVVKRQLRQVDSAYRYGGEEFTILLPMTTVSTGTVTAERIREEFAKETFSPAGNEIHVTVSIGVAQYRPHENGKGFVDRADRLMYQAKKRGKNTVCSES